MNVPEPLWLQLLDLRRAVAEAGKAIQSVCYGTEGLLALDGTTCPVESQAMITREPGAPDDWRQSPLLEERLWLATAPGCDPNIKTVLELYAPLALADWVASASSFVVVHMAQSIDGRVSTVAGHSKWIGNDDNLRHAHRLRALVDGVLVGGTTARLDMPRLDVRRAHGDNPVRIILSDRFSELGSLPRVDGMRTLIVGSGERPSNEACRDDFETMVCERRGEGIDVVALLAQLRDRGIRKLLVEGGPKTFFAFQHAGAVDWLQLHIAPMLFGSGRPVLRLPEIENVDDAIALRNPKYTLMGDAIMVTATLR